LITHKLIAFLRVMNASRWSVEVLIGKHETEQFVNLKPMLSRYGTENLVEVKDIGFLDALIPIRNRSGGRPNNLGSGRFEDGSNLFEVITIFLKRAMSGFGQITSSPTDTSVSTSHGIPKTIVVMDDGDIWNRKPLVDIRQGIKSIFGIPRNVSDNGLGFLLDERRVSDGDRISNDKRIRESRRAEKNRYEDKVFHKSPELPIYRLSNAC